MMLLDQRTQIRTKKTRKTFMQKAFLEVCFKGFLIVLSCFDA